MTLNCLRTRRAKNHCFNLNWRCQLNKRQKQKTGNAQDEQIVTTAHYQKNTIYVTGLLNLYRPKEQDRFCNEV